MTINLTRTIAQGWEIALIPAMIQLTTTLSGWKIAHKSERQ
jgi:hypothetical protein